MSKIRLTVVAPVYNEADVIGRFHARLGEVLASLRDVESKILYVVDPGTDNTVDILRDVVACDSRTKVILLSARFGHQMSLIAGIDKALESDAIVMMDSDLQHPPELIPALLEKYRHGFEIVHTFRTDTEEIGFLRKIAGNFFYYLLGKLSDLPMGSNVADFRLISGRVARIISSDFRERNMFLRGLLSWVGFKQSGIEYVAQKRGGGRSKYSLSRMFQFASAGILSFSARPLQIGVFLGISFSFLSVLFIAWVIVQFLISRALPSGWTTLVILLLLFSGIQLTVLGIIGAYIGGVFEEVKRRPRYLIEEEISRND
jgi:glycosyltransferase involved in cell wall biosynthesis